MLSAVPYWFLNFISQKFCAYFIKFMRKYAPKVNDPRSDWTKRIQANPAVYAEIKRRLHEELNANAL